MGISMKEDCIFCKLANGIIPTKSIYEDDDFKIIMDASPATRGHALIVPKEHNENIYDLPDGTAEKVFKLARDQAARIKETLGADGFNIVQNNGEIAGQTVFHFHMHLIPRYKDDGQLLGWKHGLVSEADIDKAYEKLKG